MIEKIGELGGDKKIEGMRELGDERSLGRGVGVVMDMGKDGKGSVVLNKL
ncbi:hypothetical protein [Staphylococcus saprophyticus]|nr:hypothetical protein [Staphylococcus saprophyticus]